MSTFADDVAAGRYDAMLVREFYVDPYNMGSIRAIVLWAAGEAQRETAERCPAIAFRVSGNYSPQTMGRAGGLAVRDAIRAEFLTTEKEN